MNQKSLAISLGKHTNFKKEKEDIMWRSDKIINGHIVLVGASGTGKTYRLRSFLKSARIQNPQTKFHIIDVHGDLDVEGADEVIFSESSGYGLNPLRISPDPSFGGVRKKVRTFISMMNRTSRKLGTKQEAVLSALLYDLYTNRGFSKEDPKTWIEQPGRVSPTIENLRRFSDAKLRQMIIGAGSKAILMLEKLNKKFQSLDKANIKQKGIEDIELGNLKKECKNLYNEYIEAIETGRELDDIIKYNSREVIQSVHERITTLEGSGIFKSTPPPFKEGSSIRRYNIKALSADEQKMFVDVLLEDLFFESRKNGERPFTDTFIIIDEAHKFVSEDDEHVINLIAKEARKFGLGLILASQSLTHFPDDIIANAATKFILGLDEMFHESTARKIRIDPKKLAQIQPHKTALIQIKSKGDLSNRFIDIELN